MDMVAGLAIATIGNILICDDTNGFHDAANIVAMVVALRAITPVQAVIGVAVFEFPGPLLGGTAVANTIGSFIDESDLASVTGATLWNLGTCWIGLPSSSSHALFGGLIRPVLISAGPSNVVWGFWDLSFNGHMIGASVSTTRVVSSSIMGIGASERPKAVRWAKANDIVTIWLITLPGAAALGILAWLAFQAFV